MTNEGYYVTYKTPVVIAVLFVLGASLPARQATFKGATRTVAVYATVTDQRGRLALDLGRDHFEIDDNGKRQEITVFANDPQPITVVVMIDRSGSMREQFNLVEAAAEQFVGQMQPNDRARIGSFANRIQVDPRDFTANHGELISVLHNDLQEQGPTPLWNAVNVAITALLHEEGRRVVLVFTDGVDSPMNFRNGNSSLKDVMKRAERENVMVYAIGLAGQSSRFVGGRSNPFGGLGGRGGGWRPAPEKPDEGLSKIAAETGGGYFELTSTDNLASTFRRVAEELHHQYVIGFAPSGLDGKIHKLALRVKGTAMTVRARKTYVASVER